MVIVWIIISVLSTIVGGILGILISGNALWSELKKQKQIAIKHLAFVSLYDRWLELKQRGKSIKEYLDKNEINSVAIYGMGRIGKRLYQELYQEGIRVEYVIDRNSAQLGFGVRCLLPEDELPETDMIIVTAICDYEEIKDALEPRVMCQLISLEKIIFEI